MSVVSVLHFGAGTAVVAERTWIRRTAASRRSGRSRFSAIRRRYSSDSFPRSPVGWLSSSWEPVKKSQARRSSFCRVWLGSRLCRMASPSSALRSCQGW